jgi:hypothetical protein
LRKPRHASKAALCLERLEDRTLLDGAGPLAGSALPAPLDSGPAKPVAQDVRVLAQREYVGSLYRTLLQRQADEFGLAAWTGALDRGADPAEIVRGILRSREYQTRLVQDLYHGWLGRAAEPFGLNVFVALLRSGGTTTAVQEGILGSKEYFNRAGGTHESFLAALYQDALAPNRVVDALGAQVFGTALSTGTSTAAVARAVLNSPEGSSARVLEYYQTYLERDADEQGLTSFVGALQEGVPEEEVITAILTSKEYLGELVPFLIPTIENLLEEDAYRSPGDRHKIQVTDPELARKLQEQGSQLVADYGSFMLLEVDRDTLAGLSQTPGVDVQDYQNVVQLNAGAFDTTAPEIQSVRPFPAAFDGKRLQLIQFAGPVLPEWHQALVQTGVEVVAYVPSNTFLVYGDNSSLSLLQELADTANHVQWLGDYADVFKLDPSVYALPNPSSVLQVVSESYLFAIQLVRDVEANLQTLRLIDQLKVGAVQSLTEVLNYVDVIVPLLPGAVRDLLASRPDVVSIAPYSLPEKLDERQNQILAGNLNSAGNGPTEGDYLAYLASKGFTQSQFDASGFVVNVSDSGIDNGTTAPNHFALYTGGVRPGESRIVYNRLVGSRNSQSTIQGQDGHGNINAHIIGGYVPSGAPFNTFPHADAGGFRYGLGVAPFVRMGSSVIFDPDFYTFPNLTTLESNAYRDGSRISSNSWGSFTGGRYDIDAQRYDSLVRDAQPSVAGNQEYVVVFAAGNDGPGARTIISPGTGKNVITVGASENVQPIGGVDGSGISDTGADNANDLISFSARGPTRDGRHKPDLVAPGTHITGGVPQVANPGVNGQAVQGFRGSGVSGGANSVYFPSGQQWYTASSGTSHATPAVAGAAALVRQYFINQGQEPPSPAMTKAALMNSARYLTGVGANDSLWSDRQGMGGLNLNGFFDLFATPSTLRDQLSADLLTASGQTRTFGGTVTDPTRPFRVTLAWTDAPGSTTGNAFVNNLDLEVTIGGQTYRGNVFSSAFSATGGTADPRNNVESVFLPAGVTGPFTITVRAANIAGNGVPNSGGPLDQDFALVVSNGAERSQPVIVPAGATVTGENPGNGNGRLDPAETVTVSLALRNIGNQPTTDLVATLLASPQVTAPSAPQSYGLLAAGSAAVARSFTFTVSAADGETLTATLQLRDGATDLGTATFRFSVGSIRVALSENFDGVTAPTLPPGWIATLTGGQSSDTPWRTSTGTADTAPNAAFAAAPSRVTDSWLDSPVVQVVSTAARLTFRNSYNFEPGFDGGVLEISLDGGAFTDIVTAGGSFVTGDYNRTLSTFYQSPLRGRRAWSGNSGGFVTTTVALPATAAGKSVQFRWRVGTDLSVGSAGMWIDTVTLTEGSS